MADPSLRRQRQLEQRVADTLVVSPPSFPQACASESVHGTYFLTSTEKEAMIKQARDKMRKARLVQVRAQEMLLASQRVAQVRERRRTVKEIFLRERKMAWKADQKRRLQQLEDEYVAALDNIGNAHRAAAELQRLKDVKEVTDALQTEEWRCCAALRYGEALQKEFARREELERKKKKVLERRKQLEDTAEMDRNLARVSAYGGKIKSNLKKLKEVIQPECKPEYEVSKLRDYKYTFMHNHWAALKDRTNAKESDTNAWEAADRKRSEYEQMRTRHAQMLSIAKKRVTQRAQAAHIQLAKEQEIERLERKLKDAQKQEREQKIAAILPGEQQHQEDDSLSGRRAPVSPPKLGSMSEVVGQEVSRDCQEISTDFDNKHEQDVIQGHSASPVKILVEAFPKTSSITITVGVPGGEVIFDGRRKELTPNQASVQCLKGLGLPSPRRVEVAESAQGGMVECAQHDQLLSGNKRKCFAKQPRNSRVVAFGTIVPLNCKSEARDRLHKSKTELCGQDEDWGKDRTPRKEGKKRQADELLEENNRRATKSRCRRCVGCGDGNKDDQTQAQDVRAATPRNISFSKASVRRKISSDHPVQSKNESLLPGAAALASAVSLLGEIWGAQFLNKLEEATRKGGGRGKLPSSIKNRLCSMKDLLEALESELHGKQKRDGRHKDDVDRQLSAAAQMSHQFVEDKRKKELEKHKKRMEKRRRNQVGDNVWNVHDKGNDDVPKVVAEFMAAENDRMDGIKKKHEKPQKKVDKISRGKSKERKLNNERPGFQEEQKSHFSMPNKDIAFLRDLLESLRRLNQSSSRDGNDLKCYEAVIKGPKKARKNMVMQKKSAKSGVDTVSDWHKHSKALSKAVTGYGLPSKDVIFSQDFGASIGPWNIDTDQEDALLKTGRQKKRRDDEALEKRRSKQALHVKCCPKAAPTRRNLYGKFEEKCKKAVSIDKGKRRSKNSPRKSVEEEPCWPEQLVQKQVTSFATDHGLGADEEDSGTKTEDVSPSRNCIIDIDAAVTAALTLQSPGGAFREPDQEKSGTMGIREVDGSQNADFRETGGISPARGGLGEKSGLSGRDAATQTIDLPGSTVDSGMSAQTTVEELVKSVQSEAFGTAKQSPLALNLPKKSGSSWERIWQEVCESIDGELGRLAGVDSVRTVEELRSSSILSSVGLLEWAQHHAQGLWEPHESGTGSTRNTRHGRNFQGGYSSQDLCGHHVLQSTTRNSAEITADDYPPMEFILGSLSEQVKELDERLRTATSSAVASSWALTESSRGSRLITDDGLPSTDQTVAGIQPGVIGSWASLPLAMRTTLWEQGEGTTSGQETSASLFEDGGHMMPRLQVRRNRAHLENKADSGEMSIETGSPVSPIGLCFDTLHDIQQRGIVVDTRAMSHGTLESSLETDRNQENRTAQHQMVVTDPESSELGWSSVLVLPRGPRTRPAAGDVPAPPKNAAAGHEAGRLMLTSLSSLDLEGGESLLAGSIDFSLWSPAKIRDIFDSPSALEKKHRLHVHTKTGDQKPRMQKVGLSNTTKQTKKMLHHPQAVVTKSQQPCVAKRPRRTLSVYGSPGKWSVKPRLATLSATHRKRP